MGKYLVELSLDGYETEEEEKAACLVFIEEQLDFSASSVKVTELPDNFKLPRNDSPCDAAEQVNVWRRLAKMAYDAWSDIYNRINAATQFDRAHVLTVEDWTRMQNWDIEVAKCRYESRTMEEKQGRK